ncbi:hypothetical protein RB595_003011 [Gaeumannomyces hyphopodioides]
MSIFDCCHRLKCATDVKISVGTTYRNSEELETTPVLDLLYVKFGPLHDDFDENGELEEEDYNEQFELLPLRMPMDITVSPLVPQTRVGKHQIRIGHYEIDWDQASEFNFDVVVGWINNCIENHDDCPAPEDVELPARLIDVGVEEDWSDLRLVLPPPGQKGEYVALSHCWGGKVEPILTGENLKVFLDHIPFSDLARNFQDALVISRGLGGRYLWIDCLCIIQDSPEDWARESSRMADIYRNACLTINAAASKGSKAGIFNRYSSFSGISPNTHSAKSSPPTAPRLPSCELRMFPKSSPDDTTVKIGPRLEKIDPPKDPAMEAQFSLSLCTELTEYMRQAQYEGPLSRRAWTLQEEVLAPRRLMYGEKQIYWRCISRLGSSDGFPGPGGAISYGNLVEYLHRPESRAQSAMTHERRNTLRSDYYSTVALFAGRNITYLSDKLPAFSGIAKICHPLFGGDYLAGIWSTDILYGLSWYTAMSDHTRKGPYRAPTWSWASVDQGMWWGMDSTRGCACPGSPNMKVLSHEVCLKTPQNPYGQITSASLRVRGYTKRLKRSRRHLWTGDVSNEFISETFWDDVEADGKYHQLTLDGEEVWVYLFEEGEDESKKPSNPEAEFLLLFLFAVRHPSEHHCPRLTGSEDAEKEESSPNIADGEGLEIHGEERRDCPPGPLESTLADISWMWVEESDQGDAKAQTGVTEGEGEEEEAAEEVIEEVDTQLHCLILSRHGDGDSKVYVRAGYIWKYKGTWKEVWEWGKKDLTLI